jgi:hypothetical protein
MADRDRVLRIIIEGKDKVSGSLNTASKNLRDLRKELKLTADQAEKSYPLIGGATGRKTGPGGQFQRDDVSSFVKNIATTNRAFSNSLKKMRRETKIFKSEFLDAFRVGKELEDQIDSALRDFKAFEREQLQIIDKKRDEEDIKIRAAQFKRRKEEIRELDILRDIRRKSKDADEKADLKDEISTRLNRLNELERIERAKARRIFQESKQEILLQTPSVVIEKIRNEFLAARKEVEHLDSAVGRLGRKAGTNLSNAFRGFRLGRTVTREITDEIRKSEGIFTRFGIAIGDATRNMGRFINLKWLFITGVITLFFNLIIRLGAALVALASSAVLAAGALGGALLAGLAQLAPVVGLLVAAFSRLGVVLNAVKLADKNRISQANEQKESMDKQRQASQRLEDSQWSLKQAIEAVGDAQLALKEANRGVPEALKRQADAIKELAQARKEAQRDIVDANLEEKEAALSLQEAELSLLDARRRLREEEERQRTGGADISDAQAALKEANERLRIAKEQGDQAEISSATQNVAIAEQNLSAINDKASETQNNIKEAEVAIKRAEINRQQAIIRDKRAKEDAKETRGKGIEGSDVVVRAQEQLKSAIEGVADAQRQVVLSNRAVRDSLHNLSVAQREVADARRDETDATKTQTAAQKSLQEALSDLSPSEKRLFNSLKRIKDIYRKVFIGTGKKDGILGPINDAMSGLIDNIAKLLLDPKIQKAAKILAGSIAKAIDKFASFALTSEFKDALIFFTNEASKNIPKIADALLNLFRGFLRIARAASPIFSDLLDKFAGVTARFEKWTKGTREVSKPGAEGGGRATVERNNLDIALGSAEKHLNSWLELGKAIFNVISALTSGAAPTGKTLLDGITEKFNEWAEWMRENPEKVHKFFERLTKNLGTLLKSLGKIALAFTSEEFTAFTQLLVEVIVPGILALIKVLGLLSQALLFLFDIPYVGKVLKWVAIGLVFERSLNKIFPISQALTNILRKGLISAFRALYLVILNPTRGFKILALMFPRLAAGIKLVGLALRAAFITSPWGLIITAIITGIILLDRKFHFLVPIIKFIGRLFTNIFGWIKKNWKLLVGLLVAPFTLVYFAIAKWKDKIIGFFKFIFNWVANNWKKIAIFTPFGLAAALILRWRDKIVDFFRFIINWVRDNWKKLLVGFLTGPFLIGGFVLGIFKTFKDKLVGFFEGAVGKIKDVFRGMFKWIREKVTGLFGWVGKQLDKLPFVGGESKEDIQKDNKFMNKVLADDELDPIRSKIKRLRKKGLTPQEIINKLIEDEDITAEQYGRLAKKIAFGAQHGMVVPGKGGQDTVPAMLTPGEWVLNRGQQSKVSKALKMSAEQTKAFIFGTNMGNKRPGPNTTKTKPSKKYGPTKFNKFNLIPQEDENGDTVWFIELANGTFGQVTDRDAKKILSSNGNYIPEYVKRSVAGFKEDRGGFRSYSLGGIVTPMAIQRFAQGGIAQQPGFGNVRSGKGNTINQNFSVTTQGETDWGYVMKLGAINAQEGF